MPATYEPISTYTTIGSELTITLSSIPSTYTDLRFVLVGANTNSGATTYIRFNSDFGSNYSWSEIYNGGFGASASRTNSSGYMYIGDAVNGQSNSIPNLMTLDVFSYASSQFKTCFAVLNNAYPNNGGMTFRVGLYRSTSAINSITFRNDIGSFPVNTIATVYGIKRA